MGFVNMLIARWHALGRGDVVAISLLAAFLVVAAVAFVQFPILGNLGFGPGEPFGDRDHLHPLVCVGVLPFELCRQQVHS